MGHQRVGSIPRQKNGPPLSSRLRVEEAVAAVEAVAVRVQRR